MGKREEGWKEFLGSGGGQGTLGEVSIGRFKSLQTMQGERVKLEFQFMLLLSAVYM